MKLLHLPNSDQIEEINQITIDYLNQIVKEKCKIDNWVKLVVEIERKIGRSTEIVLSKK